MLFSRHRTGIKRPERLYAFPHQRVTRIDTRIRVQHLTKKKLFIKTWGCQMNVYDSARMADVLAPLGYQPVEAPDGADMVILNTCHIREKASEKVFSELGRLRIEKSRQAAEEDGRRMIIAVAGCVAQAEGEEIMARAPFVDMVFGPQTYHQLPEMVARASRAAGERVLNTDFPVESKFDFLPGESAATGVSSFLSVQEGCDKFCTFCVVPYTRGAEFSRPAAQILAEARRMVAGRRPRDHAARPERQRLSRRRPVTGTTWGLGRLIRELAEIDGLLRIRYTTSHPRDMDDDLIAAHGDVPQLMPFVHLPVQSGSDRILAAMNRKHTADDYRRIIDRMRKVAARSGAVVGLHRRLPRRARRRFRGVPAADHRYRFRPGLLLQIQRPPRHAGGRPGRCPGAGSGDDRTAGVAPATAQRPAGRLQRSSHRPHHAGSARPHRQAARPAHGPKPLYAVGAGERTATPCRNGG